MSTQRFTPEFKEEAVKQVVERGYSVPDVAARPDDTAVANRRPRLHNRQRTDGHTRAKLDAGTDHGLRMHTRRNRRRRRRKGRDDAREGSRRIAADHPGSPRGRRLGVVGRHQHDPGPRRHDPGTVLGVAQEGDVGGACVRQCRHPGHRDVRRTVQRTADALGHPAAGSHRLGHGGTSHWAAGAAGSSVLLPARRRASSSAFALARSSSLPWFISVTIAAVISSSAGCRRMTGTRLRLRPLTS